MYQHRMIILVLVLLAVVIPVAASARSAPDKPRSHEGMQHDVQTAPLQKNLSSASGTKWEFKPTDGEWTPIKVPAGGWKTQGFKTNAGTYRAAIAIPTSAKGHVVRLNFAAVNFGAHVLAGPDEKHLKEIAKHLNGWMPFTADLTGIVVPGKSTLIEVQVDGREAFRLANKKFSIAEGASWYDGVADGIIRGVSLEIVNPIHIDDIQVVTERNPDTLRLTALVTNDSDREAQIELDGHISAASEASGNPAYPSLRPITVSVAAHRSQEVKFPNVAWPLGPSSYWWPNVPYKAGYRTCMHEVTLDAVSGGGVVAEREQQFGFRTFSAVGDHYELNGVHTNLRGDNQQEANFGTDAYGVKPGFGPPSPSNEGWPQAVDNLLRLNFNVMRIHQIPATPYMLEVADEMGLMLVAESPLRGSEQKEDFVAGHDSMLAFDREMALRDRDHPSIVIWSAANEWSAPIKEAISVIRAVDQTRPIIADGVNGDIGPGIINMQHYVGGIGKLPQRGGTPRTDRPYGETEAVWMLDNTPQGFTWMATSIPLRRALGDADLRNYVLNNAWPNYVPGEGRDTEILERAVKKFGGTGDPNDFKMAPNIDDAWHNTRIHLLQQSFSPIMVADLEFDRANAISNKRGDWPIVRPDLPAGQSVTRVLTVFNDDLSGDQVTVRWEVHSDSRLIAQGETTLHINPGEHLSLPARFTAPDTPGEVVMSIVALKGGKERYREDRQRFTVSAAAQDDKMP